MINAQYRSLESLKVMGNAPKLHLGPSIKVLLWNVFKCKMQGWHEHFESLVENKDLVLLQEAVLNSPFDQHFESSNEHQWIMARSFKHVKSNIETGVKTGASAVAKDYRFASSYHSEPITQTRKMSLASEYELQGYSHPLLVINAHMINFVSTNKFVAHLDVVFQALRGHKGPVLVAGDFNTWNNQRLRHLKTIAASFSLKEVNITRRPRLNHMFKHLDHIFYRGLEVSKVQVHSDITSSDHYPISLSLQPLANEYTNETK